MVPVFSPVIGRNVSVNLNANKDSSIKMGAKSILNPECPLIRRWSHLISHADHSVWPSRGLNVYGRATAWSLILHSWYFPKRVSVKRPLFQAELPILNPNKKNPIKSASIQHSQPIDLNRSVWMTQLWNTFIFLHGFSGPAFLHSKKAQHWRRNSSATTPF